MVNVNYIQYQGMKLDIRLKVRDIKYFKNDISDINIVIFLENNLEKTKRNFKI